MQAMLAYDLALVLMRQCSYLRRNVVAAMVDETKAYAAAVDVDIKVT